MLRLKLFEKTLEENSLSSLQVQNEEIGSSATKSIVKQKQSESQSENLIILEFQRWVQKLCSEQ